RGALPREPRPRVDAAFWPRAPAPLLQPQSERPRARSAEILPGAPVARWHALTAGERVSTILASATTDGIRPRPRWKSPAEAWLPQLPTSGCVAGVHRVDPTPTECSCARTTTGGRSIVLECE